MATKIDPKRIRTDLGTQGRTQTDESTVEDYAESMRRGDQFPPITVFIDRETNLLILVDGFHRLKAHLIARPDEEIEVTLLDGTLSEALWMSFTVNAKHGLRRTTADKRRIIAAALRREKGVKMSDRQIAEHVGVDKNTVASVRRELEAAGEIPHVENRQGKDGKSYEVKNAKPEPQDPPEASESDVMIALPKFPDGKPQVLGKILFDFFDKEYLNSLVTTLQERMSARKR